MKRDAHQSSTQQTGEKYCNVPKFVQKIKIINIKSASFVDHHQHRSDHLLVKFKMKT